MQTRWRLSSTVAAIAVTFAMAGSISSCSQPDPHPAAPPPLKQAKAQAYSAAIAEVNEYLAVWRQQGRPRAANRFMVAAERGPDPIRLSSGKVISYRQYRWVSQDRFTLFVMLDLHFAGSPGAWDSGLNGRFVTFTRQAGQSHYLMYFATGP